MKKLEIGDIVEVTPPLCAEQSYKFLGRVENIDKLITIDLLVYLDTKRESITSHLGKRKVLSDEITNNYKTISMDEYMDINPEYFI